MNREESGQRYFNCGEGAMEARESDIWVLGEELMVEILTRVGRAKWAVRSKLVCKFWCSLVVCNNTDSHWLRRWYQINPNPNKEVALFTTYETLSYESNEYSRRVSVDCICNDMRLDFLPCNDPVYVLDSHKDLLLCCPDRSDHSCYYLCNPFTRQWTALPPPPPGLRHRQPIKEEVIRFNEDSKVGFTVSTGRLTVVRVIPFQMIHGLEPEERHVRIWVLERNGEWKEVGDQNTFHLLEGERSCKKMVSYQGRLVWLSRDIYNYKKELSLLNCDFNSNDCTHLPLTPGFPAWLHEIGRSKITIGVCQGRLRLALLVDRYTKLTVWELDDHRRDWDMVRELDLRKAGESSRDWVRFRSIHERKSMFKIRVEGMALHPEDGDILYMVVTMTGNGHGARNREWSSHLFMCNLDKTTLELIRTFPTNAECPKIFPLVQPSWPTPVPKVISDIIIA